MRDYPDELPVHRQRRPRAIHSRCLRPVRHEPHPQPQRDVVYPLRLLFRSRREEHLVETRHHVQMAQLLAPRLLRRRIPRPHAEGNVHGLQHGERLHDIRQREPETRKQPELRSPPNTESRYNVTRPDISTWWTTASPPCGTRTATEWSTQHRPDEHRRAERRRSRQVSLRLGRAPSYAYTHVHIPDGEPYSSTRPHSATAKLDYGKQWKTTVSM